MLMYETARKVVALGREAFFPTNAPDLPLGRSLILQGDDLAPQFGFVGDRYPESRILLLGINPGNGGNNNVRSKEDARMMPSILRFASAPDEETFKISAKAYMDACRNWQIWMRHCYEVMGAGKISLDQIAYSNCLPWRTQSKSNFSEVVARNTARLYARPLIQELNPRLIVALGKQRVPSILMTTGLPLPPVITWNRSQALTPSVKRERASAAAEILKFVMKT